jgi:antitoxin component YwqK of YwqJK toxin-antitoxin module
VNAGTTPPPRWRAKRRPSVALRTGLTLIGVIALCVAGAILLVWQSDDSSEQESNAKDIEPGKTVVITPLEKTHSASNYPINYSIGTLDPRFGMDQATFNDIIQQAALTWETSAGIALFRYDPEAPFTINLIFDERQQRRLEEKRLRATIADNGKSFDELKNIYDSQVELKDQAQRQYDAAVSEYHQRLNAHNATVAMWNNAGGAPRDTYEQLEQERALLDEMRKGVESRQAELNEIVASINQLAASLNEMISKDNLAITYYNGTFASSREFEKGAFDGSQIAIYEFDEQSDLRLTLVHELGHALGFGHVNSPTAVMYYKQGQQDATHIVLTQDDLRLVSQRFGRANE